MAKKQKHPEHVNLERYLISYADFITLLFATFVVLYALSQVDIKDFKALESSIQQAFSAPSIMQGTNGMMENTSASMLDGSTNTDSVIPPLMMEYISQKYENDSMNSIEKSVNDATKSGELNGVEAINTDKGLLLRFDNDYLFKKGSAEITPAARKNLDKVGAMIAKKFILHNMRVEGHTDNQPFKSPTYPSNWELSSARACSIIRYYIDRFGFMKGIFTAVGFADTRPITDNKTEQGRAKNRRAEILILKNKYKSQESPTNDIANMSKEDQAKMQSKRIDTINRIEQISEAAQKLANMEGTETKNTIILNNAYNKEMQRLDQQTKALNPDGHSWLKPPGGTSQIKVFEDK